MASTKLDATFTGLAAHSGADPQKGKNALLAGAAAALAIHGITRPIGEVTALNVGTLVAGQGRNVVAPNAFMQLEVRGETEELNAYMRDQAIRKIKLPPICMTAKSISSKPVKPPNLSPTRK